ncbi:MAG: C10 family peptidase [Muribaculaceae bacterium]|nr:C10 family peptidase [Muribaculaceae bacterium]
MNLRTNLLIAASMAAAGVLAAPLTPDQAVSRLQQTMPKKAKSILSSSVVSVKTINCNDGQPAAYIFDNPGSGFMILSADDIAYPMLGYSDSGSFSSDEMPESMKWWLSEYAAQIEWARSKGVTSKRNAPAAPSAEMIAPMVKTRWDQGAPYNNDCPNTRSGVKCVTGCVATSMAQVMNYHKYPLVGEGIKQYTCSSLNKRLTINYAQKEFDWNNMLDYYSSNNYNEAQAAAVAYLMKACGYAVNMNYNSDASGTQGYLIAEGAKEYFKYDAGTRYEMRLPYSSSEWASKIIDNLKNVGPVVINGQAPLQGGHSFVCDGYDGNGYFHINWGWGGLSDGYFAIDALDPDAQGTGGAVGGFNFQQNAIFGMQPPTGKPVEAQQKVLFQWGTATATISGKDLKFGLKDYSSPGWGNINYASLTVKPGVIIENVENPTSVQYAPATVGGRSEITLGMYNLYPYPTSSFEATLPTLPDGRYKVIAASLDSEFEGATWQPVQVPWGMMNYVMLEVEHGLYYVSDVEPSALQISNVEIASKPYSGKNIMLEVELTNDSDIELTQGLQPRIFNKSGQLLFYGNSMMVGAAAKTSETREMIMKLYKENGSLGTVTANTDVIMRFFDPQTGLYYPDVNVEFTLLPYPGSSQIQLMNYEFDGAERLSVTIDGNRFSNLYQLPDNKEVAGTLQIKSKTGYFDGQILMDVETIKPSDPYNYIPYLNGVFSSYCFISQNEIEDLHFSFPFVESEPDQLYVLKITYVLNNKVNLMNRLQFCFQLAGVGEITDDNNSPVEYFNLQGVKISNPEAGSVVIEKKGGKVSKIVAK